MGAGDRGRRCHRGRRDPDRHDPDTRRLDTDHRRRDGRSARCIDGDRRVSRSRGSAPWRSPCRRPARATRSPSWVRSTYLSRSPAPDVHPPTPRPALGGDHDPDPGPRPRLDIRGAIDLSGLGRPAPQPAGPAAASAGAVVDIADEAGFTAVIQQSTTVPVVMVLWAAWSEVSTQVADDLVSLAAELDGRFVVARLDADANPQLAQAVGAQAIPTVLGVLRGQPVPLFQGPALAEEIRGLLDRLLEVAAANQITGRGGDRRGRRARRALSPPSRRCPRCTRKPSTRSRQGTWAGRRRLPSGADPEPARRHGSGRPGPGRPAAARRDARPGSGGRARGRPGRPRRAARHG